MYSEFKEIYVPRNSNIIISHAAYKIILQEDNSLKLKARICAHEKRDKEKDKVRKENSTAQFPVIRLNASIASLLGLKFARNYISAACLQSSPCPEEIYMRPPLEDQARLVKLVNLPYGISEAGLQWQTTCESLLINGAIVFERVHGVSHLSIKKNGNGSISMLISKVTDDLLLCGT